MAAAGLLLVFYTAALPARSTKSDSVVKITAEAGKPDAAGKQVIKLFLTIDKGWHIYANPVGNEDFANAATVVKVTGATPPREVKIDYPAGKVEKDAQIGDYKVYEDKVVITAHVQRAPGDTGPLDVSVSLQSCNAKTCLQPATVKVPVK
jgi:DsbC/DsbD-like thiol-disulfide interchange protein